MKRSGGVAQAIVDKLMPKWKNIPYYQVSNTDTKVFNYNKSRIWHTDPEFINTIVHEGSFYRTFFDREAILKCYEDCLNDKGFSNEETILIEVAIIEMLLEHFNELKHRVHKYRQQFYYSSNFNDLINKSGQQNAALELDKISAIDVGDSDLSPKELYQAAEKLWQAERYKESLLMHEKIYSTYKYPSSAYRCGTAYYMGLGVKNNYNIAASYFFLPELAGQRMAIYYRGMLLINVDSGYFNLTKGLELLQKSFCLGIEEAQYELQKYNYVNNTRDKIMGSWVKKGIRFLPKSIKTLVKKLFGQYIV